LNKGGTQSQDERVQHDLAVAANSICCKKKKILIITQETELLKSFRREILNLLGFKDKLLSLSTKLQSFVPKLRAFPLKNIKNM